MKVYYNKSFFAFFAILFSCGRPDAAKETASNEPEVTVDYTNLKLPADNYSGWMEENSSELSKSYSNDKLEFILNFIPSDYAAYLTLQGEKPTQEYWDTLKNNYDSISIFKLQIKSLNSNEEFYKTDKPDASLYEDRVKYYSFEFQQNIFAVLDNSDTINCNMFHYERSYGVSPYSTFMIGFEKFNPEKDVKIIIREKYFTNKNIEFKYSKKELSNVPQLKLF